MAFTWSNIGSKIEASYYTEIKNNVDVKITDMGISEYNWTENPVSVGAPIKAADTQELKSSIDYLEDENYCQTDHNGNYISNDDAYNSTVDTDKDINIYSNVNNTVYDSNDTTIYSDQDTSIDNDKNTGYDSDKDTGIDNDKNTGYDSDRDVGVDGDQNTGYDSDKDSSVESGYNYLYDSDKDGSINDTADYSWDSTENLNEDYQERNVEYYPNNTSVYVTV